MECGERAAAGQPGGHISEARKYFFFEKKKQKTFVFSLTRR